MCFYLSNQLDACGSAREIHSLKIKSESEEFDMSWLLWNDGIAEW